MATDGTDRIMVGRSKLNPQPCTRTSLGYPIGSNISGRNIPLLPTSTHLLSIGWKANISREGYARSMEGQVQETRTNLSVRVIRRLESHIFNAHFPEEDPHEALIR